MPGFKTTEQMVDRDDLKALCYLGTRVHKTEEEQAGNPTNIKEDRGCGFPNIHRPARNLGQLLILEEHGGFFQQC